MNKNPLFAIDFYKADHRNQYPKGTTEVYSNFTPRSNKFSPWGGKDQKLVFFGLRYFIQDFLINSWNDEFFREDKGRIVAEYQSMMDSSLGYGTITTEHIEALHDLQYLPLRIKALDEGSLVPMGVPVLTMVNTHPDFFWLTNYLETILSAYLWKPCTSATTAFQYRELLERYAKITGITYPEIIDFQAHDFSFRGLSNWEDAALSGAAHLTSFVGTDSVPAIDLINKYYDGYTSGKIIGCSVPATEHSVMCMGTQDSEIDTFKRLINEVYPSGIVSIVSDTWDFWKVITEYTVDLKSEIMARDGKVVIRPDSGDPIKIICGDENAPKGTPEYKGAVECLWEVFDGSTNRKGYKTLDEHIGLIYGDSITLERANEILSGLEAKGFASDNIVFGVGSFTYQYVTRDTYGFAVKATSGVVNGVRREIFKNPKTDDGTKRSAKGLLMVSNSGGKYSLHDQQTPLQEARGCLKTVFEDGEYLSNDNGIDSIRNRIKEVSDEIKNGNLMWGFNEVVRMRIENEKGNIK